MKNLMIYLNPSKGQNDYFWSNETETLLKIQIDNSLRLGWKREDIMLVTNFDYEYDGVASIRVPDSLFCVTKPTVSKIYTLIYLIQSRIVNNGLYWFHDTDAFQLEPFTEEEIADALGGCDLGLTDYGKTTINDSRDKRWSTGSMFFTKESLDIFEIIRNWCDFYKANEEVALLDILKKVRFQPLKDRIKKFDISYNVATRKRDLSACYEMADKPVRVLHFHPFDDREVKLEGYNNMEVCMYGKNRMGKVLLPEELIKIFNKHQII